MPSKKHDRPRRHTLHSKKRKEKNPKHWKKQLTPLYVSRQVKVGMLQDLNETQKDTLHMYADCLTDYWSLMSMHIISATTWLDALMHAHRQEDRNERMKRSHNKKYWKEKPSTRLNPRQHQVFQQEGTSFNSVLPCYTVSMHTHKVHITYQYKNMKKNIKWIPRRMRLSLM